MTASASRRASAGVRLFFQTPLDWLVLAVPAAFAIRFVPAWSNESLLFIAAGVGIIPLAGWLGRATEQLSARTGAGIGGFLNATFGNAAELIIALMALSKGLTTVVKASLTGSIIGNLLLVLGASAFAEFSPPPSGAKRGLGHLGDEQPVHVAAYTRSGSNVSRLSPSSTSRSGWLSSTGLSWARPSNPASVVRCPNIP
jgi:hypothetical protein